MSHMGIKRRDVVPPVFYLGELLNSLIYILNLELIISQCVLLGH